MRNTDVVDSALDDPMNDVLDNELADIAITTDSDVLLRPLEARNPAGSAVNGRNGAVIRRGYLTLNSTAFADGGAIPMQYTCDGANQPPPLSWEDVPEGTRSFALIVHDPDAPKGDYTHWVLFDLPATTQQLTGGPGETPFGLTGTNDFGDIGYGGPCPPPGHGPHHYQFDLYALDTDQLNLVRGARRSEVESAVRGHILAETTLQGIYERQGSAD